jgi:hypothetical protein
MAIGMFRSQTPLTGQFFANYKPIAGMITAYFLSLHALPAQGLGSQMKDIGLNVIKN